MDYSCLVLSAFPYFFLFGPCKVVSLFRITETFRNLASRPKKKDGPKNKITNTVEITENREMCWLLCHVNVVENYLS